MKILRCALLLSIFSFCLLAHPMGNFSINHYTRIDLRAQGPELTYILDFAEIPTSELFGEWGSGANPGEALQPNAARQAAVWAEGLTLKVNSERVPVKWSKVQAGTVDGAGGMAVLRVVMTAKLGSISGGALEFRDGNFANRTGWKEVVIGHADGVRIQSASHTDRDLSKALTVYPADLTVTPPQDLSASVTWHADGLMAQPKRVGTPAIKAAAAIPMATGAAKRVEMAAPRAAETPSFATRQPEVAGTVTRGDYLSQMLRQKHFGFTAVMLGLFAAFGLGSVHALSPGHGKTIVAAYLVGSRGTLKHAGILGLTVTFTHTISVFLLGIGVLFFQKYVIPEKIVPVLGAISGLSIVAIGAYLLYKRSMALAAGNHSPEHKAEKTPDSQPQHRPHSHAHAHSHAHHRQHSHSEAFAHTHSHDGSTHTHAVPDNITMGSLLGLGVSGGLVPCPSALILLLSAISLGQTAVGLALLGAFSAGLAVVLMAVGGLVLYGKSLLPKRTVEASHPILRLLPVFSSVVVIVVGLLMTLTAAGVIQPVKLFS